MGKDGSAKILKVARLGNPVLRRPADWVPESDIKTSEFQDLIDCMIVTMREYDGVGLAAPQVHIGRQVCVIEVQENPRYPGMPTVPLTVLINPKIVSRSKKLVEDWEGCLSIPELRGLVPRNDAVVCEALDRDGNRLRLEAKDFLARVIQHELDHLQGHVYLDRMPHLKSLTFLQEFSKYYSEDEPADG